MRKWSGSVARTRFLMVSALAALLAACGGGGKQGGDSGSPSETAARLPGFEAPGVGIVRDDSNANAASCKTGQNLEGGRHYPVTLTSASGKSIVFEVIEPKRFDCTRGNPLVLHGHGFGGSRTQDPAGTQLERFQDNGYAVISIDQRGFHDSSGTVRVMDPNFEGRDLLQILDWAETHLDYLAHDRKAGGYNLVAASTGGSYGGMYQLLLHNLDPKHRLDVLTPDITPHDLRYSLNPNGTTKSVWALLLVLGGEAGANQPLIGGLDPAIKETLLRGVLGNVIHAGALPFFYYHSSKYFLDALPESEQLPMDFLTGDLSGGMSYDFPAIRPAKVDILFSQGIRDTLFNFNEGWANYLGYKALGGDVRLMSHESGHILPGTQTLLGQLGPLNDAVGGLVGLLNTIGISLPDLQTPSGPGSCGGLSKDDAVLAFINEKLKPADAQPADAAVKAGLDRLRSEVCLSLAPDKAVWVAPDHVADRNRVEVPVAQSLIPVPNSVLGVTSLLLPTFIPLDIPADKRTVAGIGRLDVTLSSLLPFDGCEVTAGLPPEFPIRACDVIIHVGFGARKGQLAAPRLLDEQITPLRGLGAHQVDMVGIGEQLADGEQLGLLVYGYNLQYLSSLSRDLLVPFLNISGKVHVPLQ